MSTDVFPPCVVMFSQNANNSFIFIRIGNAIAKSLCGGGEEEGFTTALIIGHTRRRIHHCIDNRSYTKNLSYIVFVCR